MKQKNPYIGPFNNRILELIQREPKDFADAERMSAEIEKNLKNLAKKYSKLMR
jgi:hypothetical protein